SSDTLTFDRALRKLEQQVPIQYITGYAHFYGLKLKVNRHTLIPRPETEELVALIRDHIRSGFGSNRIKILDIGTGSGCIPISLKTEFPNAEIFALDVSEKALEVARGNSELHQVTINFFQNDILNVIYSDHLREVDTFDIIVSNPPYVRELEKDMMQANVLEYEPKTALFVENDDPLKFYRAICEFAQIHLRSEGKLFFEINEYLGVETVQLLESYDFTKVELIPDLFGKDRMIFGVKK
ncbi:MAG: peptide chain release factor N(5)-glutamine methyltransferase, partial [Psychroserpens sp.]|nr:peptide chain release factor N(5)-glutamine methyltransferase [Psychroserpens sp.]